jgi:hypothetical protein
MAKQRRDKTRQQMSDAQWNYLTDKPMPQNFETFALKIDFHGNTEQLWQENRDVILAEHAKENPGTRPAMFWLYDAPRLPVGTLRGCHYDSQLSQPRKRTGGTGTAAYEVTSVGPSFDYGIPNVWVGIDEDDPPTFESEAAYLKRHGLLFAGEEKRSDFGPETVHRDWCMP